ncbi:MAG: EAL domain-containing protein [Methylovulum sp.]|nr:EAL domain-containing protein [Methylovulum sp.]
MENVFDFLLVAQAMLPYDGYLFWNTAVFWLFAIANIVAAGSYFAMSVGLGLFAYKRASIKFKWKLWVFSAFIFSCGFVQLLSAGTAWHPVYGLNGIAQACAAVVTAAAVFLLWRLVAKAWYAPGPSGLCSANVKLEHEILSHQETKAQLNQLSAKLDRPIEWTTRELSANELRFRTIFAEAPLGIAVIDSMTGRFHDVNPKFMDIVGRSKEELMDSDWAHITHPEDIQEEMDKVSLLNGGVISAFNITKRYIRPDNAIAWTRLSSVPIKPALFHLHMIEDITQTRWAEQENQQLGNILEQSINEIYIINTENLRFEHVNQGGINNLGFSLDELKNMTPLDIKPEFDVVLFTDLIRLLISGEQDQLRFETTHQRKNGTCYPVEICFQIYRNHPDYIVAICLDISQRKAIERNLLDERNLLLNLINNIPDYIYCKNTAGQYLFCNTAVANYFNQPVENITGRTDFDFVDTETALSHGEHDAALLIQGCTLVNEEAITLSDGKQVLLETLKTPVIDNDGNLLGLIGVGRDITERKAHEGKINRLSNFYANLSKINHAIVQIDNEEELFANVCTIAVGLQQVKLAWIGRPDESSERMVPVAKAGDIQAYLTDLVVSVDPDVPEGRGPVGRAYRENRIVVIDDFQADPSTKPWHDHADRCFAWGSVCSVPIAKSKSTYAVLSVYSLERNLFDEEALKLMAELSLDLSFALDSYVHEAARRLAEEKLELAAKVFNQSGEGITITDKNNDIVSVNPGFTVITGYQEHEVLGKNPRILASGRQDKEFYRELWELLLKNGIWQGEIWNRHKNGFIYPEWLTISVVRDEAGEIINHIAVFTDITPYKVAEKRIEHLGHYDSLTNLPNRLLLKSRADYQLIVAERHKKPFALLFIDLDHFKNINDSMGHSIGDQVLIEVGRRLLACVREEDTVARLGGDEFNILLADSNENGAAIVAGKIMALLIEAIIYEDYQLYITPSIGISLYPDNGDSYEILSKNADTALYQAKKNGRNQYQFFTPTMQQQTQKRMEIESGLRHAIARNELMVYFQPQINAHTGQIIGAEALLRWRHPVLGMVSPAEFIPVAEECGLILPIGDWVLEQSIAQARLWHDSGFPLTVAVNLSLAQFRANTLVEKVKQTLEQCGLPPQFLELELTESIAMQNAELAIETTRQLTRLGINLSIDDFGTGYSSLSYLQRFSLHKLKIDQSFTRGMIGNKDSENIVDAVISLAKSLNLKTIAEGVETIQQLDMFKLKLCDEIQGYYFSKPLPADEFMVLMKGDMG